MNHADRIEELLLDWYEACERGEPITPQELCQDCPELLPEFQQHIDELQSLQRFLGASDVAQKETPDPHATSDYLGDIKPITATVPKQAGKYQILDEIARGGMGVVWRVHDPEFKRTLALKVLLDTGRGNTDAQRRFLEEAEVTGQLQHPGIPPAHELGRLDDGSPFFAMKLIEGRTLAKLLKERESPNQDLPRFLSIFEQICQTVAYAHSRGVIHRDLKPLNIMVGAFGEVQVMDWGLAKQIDRQNVSPEAQAKKSSTHITTLDDPEQTAAYVPAEDLKSTDRTPRTRVGSVMGTPAYMAPEQARGEIDELDECCDVFGLGAVLCEILTGQPAFVGEGVHGRLSQAVDGDVSDAYRRLDGCGADEEIVQLCKRCLAEHKEDRPKSASDVADAIVLYQEQVQEKLRQADIAKREAQVKAEEESKRREVEQAKVAAEQSKAKAEQDKTKAEQRKRRVQMVLGLLVVLILLGVGGVAIWYQDSVNKMALAKQEKQFRGQQDEIQLKNMLAEFQTMHDEINKMSHVKGYVFKLLNKRKQWSNKLKKALITLGKRGKQLLSRIQEPQRQKLSKQVSGLLKHLEHDQREWQIASELSHIRVRWMTIFINNELDYLYAKNNYPLAFQKANIGLLSENQEVVAKRIRSMRIKEQLIASLDDWAYVILHYEIRASNRKAGIEKQRYSRLRSQLLKVARLADNSPWGNRFRIPEQWYKLYTDKKSLIQFINNMPSSTSPQLVALLGLFSLKKSSASKAWIQATRSRFARDYAINNVMGLHLWENSAEEAIGYFRAAIAINPNSVEAYNGWGAALMKLKQNTVAIAKFQQAIKIDPKVVGVYNNWGLAMAKQKMYKEAIVKYKKAITLDPNSASVYNNWGSALADQKQHDAAIAKFQQAIKIDPNLAEAYYNWGKGLKAKKLYSEAIAKFQLALKVDPNSVHTYVVWANTLCQQKRYNEAIAKFRSAIKVDPDYAGRTYHSWGLALAKQKQYDAAIAKYEQAVKIDPELSEAYNNWGIALEKQNQHKAAIAKFRQAIKVDPKNAGAWTNLGGALKTLGKFSEAEKATKNALRIDPTLVQAWHGLGGIRLFLKDRPGAAAALEKAVALDPKNATYHIELGMALSSLKDYPKAITAYRKAIKCAPREPKSYIFLGSLLLRQGRIAESKQIYQKALTIMPNKHLLRPFALKGQQQCQVWLDREKRIPSVQSVSLREHLALIKLCVSYNKRYRDAVKLFTQLFARAPKLAENVRYALRIQAACAALLSAEGKSRDSRNLTAKQRMEFRQQALIWLKAELNTYANLTKINSLNTIFVQDRLQRWQNEEKLSSVRNAKSLAMLPAEERKHWTKLWHDVATLLKKTRNSYIETTYKGTLTTTQREKAHTVTLKAGKTYIIDMHSKQFDTLLKLMDKEGDTWAQDDDSGEGTNARIEFTPTENKVYRIVASSHNNRGRGAYIIIVREFTTKK